MPTVWYVLSDDGRPYYRNLTMVSAVALRHTNPGVRIGLLCDPQSADAAWRDAVTFEEVFDSIVVHDAPFESPVHRNRYLKIRARQLIDGAFWYLDSDTLAVDRLALPQALAGSVYMAYDYLPGCSAHAGPPPGARRHFDACGWPFPPPRYFNGGVVHWTEAGEAYRFAELWLEYWLWSVKRGVSYDQPALAHTDALLGGMITPLPPALNGQVTAWAGFARGAAIWHYWLSQSSLTGSSQSVLDCLVHEYARTGRLDQQLLDQARTFGFPWMESQGLRVFLQTRHYRWALKELPLVLARLLRLRSRSRRFAVYGRPTTHLLLG